MPHHNPIETEDALTFTLHKRVTGCQIGPGFAILLYDYESVRIEIRGLFTLETSTEVSYFDASQPSSLGENLKVVLWVVGSLVLFKDGRMQVNFENGARINAAAETSFQNWAPHEAPQDSYSLESAPDGGLNVWYQ